MTKNDLDISIVIPVLNEEKNIINLIKEILDAFKNKKKLEIIVVDDGSTDNTYKNLIKLKNKTPLLKVIKHKSNYGQSISLRSGIIAAKKNIIATIDGDGQNNPKDIIKLTMNFKKNEKFFLVIGNRVNRNDTLSRKIASRLAFLIRRVLFKDSIPDTGCALKIFKRDDFLMLPFFNHIHRFFPVIFKAYGGKIVSVNVDHRRRKSGVSKYSNITRALVGIYDVIGVLWLIKRTNNPNYEK